MAHTYSFEIGFKTGITDPVGQGLKYDILHLGLGRVKNVTSAQLYRIFGQLSAEERGRIANELLCDPVLHESREGRAPEKDPSMVIDVWYKPGVTDAVGESVQKGILDLNIHGVKSVRTGMRYHLQGVTRRELAEKIALSLLVNPLVHESVINAD